MIIRIVFLCLIGFAPAFAVESAPVRGIRNEKCFPSEEDARFDIFDRLRTGKELCSEGLTAAQYAGWSCKQAGCKDGGVRCVTQYRCEAAPGVLTTPGTPTTSAGGSVPPVARPSAVAPTAYPNPSPVQGAGPPPPPPPVMTPSPPAGTPSSAPQASGEAPNLGAQPTPIEELKKIQVVTPELEKKLESFGP